MASGERAGAATAPALARPLPRSVPPLASSRAGSAASVSAREPVRRAQLLPRAAAVTLAVLLLPVAAGLAGTVAPAFDYLPALGADSFGLAPWRALLDWPGLPDAVRLSLVTGLVSTLVALAITVLACAAWHGTRAFAALERLLSPLLSVPHAAAAFGLAFLIAPSGWIARTLSPWATGWERPPDLLIVNDPAGLALIAGLVVKEVPFLLLMTVAALGQLDANRALLLARTQGYGRVTAWLKCVFPRVYPQIRLPVYAVIAYSASTVDVAMILGPSTPSTLSVQVLSWFADPDVSMRLRGAAGALLQLGLVALALLAWRAAERAVRAAGLRWIESGTRGARDAPVRAGALALASLVAGASVLAIAGLAVWSVAGLWSFPDALPAAPSLRTWTRRADDVAGLAGTTAAIGVASTLVALTLTLACLEAEYRHGVRRSTRALWLLYVPLLVPQTAFVTGLQTLAVATDLDGRLASVVAAHVVFVLPYVFLSLADPFRAWDSRRGLVAATLGASPERILWRVRLPMLLRSVLVAAAVGFAVSVGQYLPTLLIGAGRVTTLTTEAVALASGGDRRLIGVHSLVQTVLPFLGFTLALAIPAVAFRHRRGLRGAAA